MSSLKKVLITGLALFLVMGQGMGAVAAMPSAPSAPTAPSAPSAPEAPQAPSAPAAPSAPSAPEAPDSSQGSSAPEAPKAPKSTRTSGDTGEGESGGSGETGIAQGTEGNGGNGGQSDSNSVAAAGSESGGDGVTQQAVGSTGESADGNVGGASIDTGAAAGTGVLTTGVNQNTAAGGASVGGTGGGASVVNSGNGAGSSNSGSATIVNENETTQTNSATIANGMGVDVNSGKNSASRNTGGNVNVTTGDANASGTMITAVNSNVDGMQVAEFNVADTQVGDLILDFGAGCIAGCGAGTAAIKNVGNGDGSNNSVSLDGSSDASTFQNNDASLENNMLVAANSGQNEADRNTGGDVSVTTGDANAAGTIVNLVNNNLAGNVVLGVINIFGDLIGDIIFPQEALAGSNTVVGNLGNGDGSSNTVNWDQSANTELTQFNSASIDNNLVIGGTTGGNDVSRNTGGSSSVTTGDVNVDGRVVNVANNNIVGGNWWLVIVNEAGKWVGKIIGSPDGSQVAGSAGMEIGVGEDGTVTAGNVGNGADSNNTVNVGQNSNTTIGQTNTANITNNLTVMANTGENSASRNVGGDVKVVTGDANVIANIINFANNNIVGSGKLYVMVVNVFGSWLGDFVGPGMSKEVKDEGGSGAGEAAASGERAIGGADVGGTTSGGGNGQVSGNGGSSGGTTAATSEETAGNLVNLGGGTGKGNNNLIGNNLGLTDEVGSVLSSSVGEAGSQVGAAKGVVNLKFNLAWLLLIIPTGLVLGWGGKRVVGLLLHISK